MHFKWVFLMTDFTKNPPRMQSWQVDSWMVDIGFLTKNAIVWVVTGKASQKKLSKNKCILLGNVVRIIIRKPWIITGTKTKTETNKKQLHLTTSTRTISFSVKNHRISAKPSYRNPMILRILGTHDWFHGISQCEVHHTGFYMGVSENRGTPKWMV